MAFTEIHEPGENDRSASGFLPPDEFERVADQFFASPNMSVRGWERAVARSPSSRTFTVSPRAVHSWWKPIDQ